MGLSRNQQQLVKFSRESLLRKQQKQQKRNNAMVKGLGGGDPSYSSPATFFKTDTLYPS
jgi:hypothetical protein